MDSNIKSGLVHLVILAILLIVLLSVLMYTGIIGCNVLPGMCEIYYQIIKGGNPKILIAYGDSGLGDHEKLEAVFTDRDILNAHVKSMHINNISYGNINEYDLVIVERAKKICTDKLRIFQSYINSGGRLVWTGDAGTELCEEDNYLKVSQREEGGEDKIIGPLARLDGERMLLFNEYLGVEYKGNYCEFTNCAKSDFSGYVEVNERDNKLVYGLSPSLKFKGDFAIVEIIKNSNAKIVASIDNTTNFLVKSDKKPWLEKDKQYNFGRKLPFIVTNGIGERVAYYAAPIESFVSEEQTIKYKAIIEQLYYGMLYK
jgi:hypothetical protein